MANKILEQFKSLKTDKEKWRFVIDNQDKGILVICDNDYTFITINDEEGEVAFDGFIGYDSGIFDLLHVLNIKAESV